MRYDKIKEFKIEFNAVLDRYNKPAYIIKSIAYNHFPSIFEVSKMFPELIDGTLEDKDRFKALKKYGLSDTQEFAIMYLNTDTEIIMDLFHTKNKKTGRIVYKLDYTKVIDTEIAELFEDHIKFFIQLYNKNCTKVKRKIKEEEHKKEEWEENESFIVEI